MNSTLNQFLLLLSNSLNFLISSLGSKFPVERFSYCWSYFPVDKVPLPLNLLVMSTIPLLQSRKAFIWAKHNSGNSFFNSGSSRHFLGVFLSIITQGDLCRQTATAFLWSLQLAPMLSYSIIGSMVLFNCSEVGWENRKAVTWVKKYGCFSPKNTLYGYRARNVMQGHRRWELSQSSAGDTWYIGYMYTLNWLY